MRLLQSADEVCQQRQVLCTRRLARGLSEAEQERLGVAREVRLHPALQHPGGGNEGRIHRGHGMREGLQRTAGMGGWNGRSGHKYTFEEEDAYEIITLTSWTQRRDPA